MKNFILGGLGFVVFLMGIYSCLSIHKISTNRNLLNRCASSVIESSLFDYYGYEDVTVEDMEKIIKERIQERTNWAEGIDVTVKGMDLEIGLLSVLIEREFQLPSGNIKKIEIEKTAIIDEG